MPALFWYEGRYRAWPWESVPSKLAWCGRAYERHGPAYTEGQVPPPAPPGSPRELRILGSVRLPLGLPHDVVDGGALDERWTCAGQRNDGSTMTYLFVRAGDRYLRFDLIGGP